MVPISVLMPTYNTEAAMLKEAVESILNQTFRDFEFIIIDDGSTDESPEYLRSLTDPRVRIIRNDVNQGIARSLNRGMRMASGKYIARMDSDDISFPMRFEIQYAFMESHPDVIACGTRIGRYETVLYTPKSVREEKEYYRAKLLFTNPGPIHPTAFIDREKLARLHIEYDESLLYSQDYDLWEKMSRYGQISFLPDPLILFRSHPNRITSKHRDMQIACHKITQKRLLSRLLDDVSEEEVDFHYELSEGLYNNDTVTPEVNEWFTKLMLANKRRKVYDSTILKHCIDDIKIRLTAKMITEKMTTAEKILLIFRVVPFVTAWKYLFQKAARKISGIGHQNAH